MSLFTSRVSRLVAAGLIKARKPARFFTGLIAVLTLLLLFTYGVKAASPPNLPTDIPWTDTGGVYDPNNGFASATFNGVADIEAAFNHGRRQEEIQLGLPANSLGTLTLPSQSVWDAYNHNEKALYILNDERVVRARQRIRPSSACPSRIGMQSSPSWRRTT